MMVEQSANASGRSFTRCLTSGSTARGVTMTKYEDIKDFYERCDKHPDHQSGMISYAMIERRLHEEIEELRQFIEKRRWQTLNDAEYLEILDELGDGGFLAFYTLIEAKLREKNT